MKKKQNSEKLDAVIEEALKVLSQIDDNTPSEKTAKLLEKINAIHGGAVAREQEIERKKQEALNKEMQHVKQVTSMDLPLNWENVFDSDERTQGVHAETISDGLIMSLSNLGRVDIEYISSVSGKDYKTVITTLKGVIFQNPETWDEVFYRGWETADEYLSGNMLHKWHAAYQANQKYHGYFRENLVAIKKVLHTDVSADNVYVTLGSPWIPTDVIDLFLVYLLGANKTVESYRRAGYQNCYTVHDEVTGSWEIPMKPTYGRMVTATRTFGTSKMSAVYIVEKTLNMKTVQVYDEVPCKANKSGVKRVVNQKETVALLEKQRKIIKMFQDWIWQDERRKKRLLKIYEDKYAYYHRRNFNGAYLEFPNMSKSVQLYPYQKNAVARVLFSPNTLLAHDVGSGKTYVMIAAGMELLRMGLSKKNMYVVPNNIVEQWRTIFKEMYPTANVLCVTPGMFVPAKRQGTLKNIRDNNFDGIIIPYSCFEQISLSRAYYIQRIREAKEEIAAAMTNHKSTSDSKRKLENLSKELGQLVLEADDPDTVFFDELGVTRLFVDEAHNFKNVPLDTKVDCVLGINSRGSKKCQDMLDKVRLVQKNNNGGGVVFATGTPITNSITDAYVMQLYLQSGSLALLDLKNFDGWIGMFAERSTEFEVDVDTNSFRLATRFSNFHNLTELTALLSQIADFHQVDQNDGIPEFDGYNDSLVSKTAAFANYLKLISLRAEDVRSGSVSRKDDNMLKITTDGRKAALDLRLVDRQATFTYQSKVARCAENVFDIFKATTPQQSTQLVFCDTSTPKSGFNMYDELKRLLVKMGIPPEQIAFIHDEETEKRRLALFAKVRAGIIRVLIGSTFKLGLGVNVQDKLIAVHHLDVPWRPADMTQREGRILRQGNTNKKVFIYRYITEGSFDAYSWQLLETKQRFICKLLAGSLSERSGANIEDTVLNYAEVKALAVGNPLIKKRVETANELERLKSLQRSLVETRISMESELPELSAKITEQKALIEQCKVDLEFLKNASFVYTKEERTDLRDKLYEELVQNVLRPKERTLCEFRGFKIVLPSNMTKEKPFVWVQRTGKYFVEMGDSKVGALIRLDNFLNDFDKFIAEQKTKLSRLTERKKGINAELGKDSNYLDAIEQYKMLLDEIDKRLGVKN